MEMLSTKLSKALTANSENLVFSYPDVGLVEPVADGDFVAGLGGATSPQQILIVPYCEGAPGRQFSMRLYGWWNHGEIRDAANTIWLPLLLAEVACVAGPKNGSGGRLIKESEYFAQGITFVAGDLGMYGRIVQGGDVGYLKIDLQGCRKFRFDFAVGEQAPGFGNALWALTSAW